MNFHHFLGADLSAAGRRLAEAAPGMNPDDVIGSLTAQSGAQNAARGTGGGKIDENAAWESANPRPLFPYGSVGLLWVSFSHEFLSIFSNWKFHLPINFWRPAWQGQEKWCSGVALWGEVEYRHGENEEFWSGQTAWVYNVMYTSDAAFVTLHSRDGLVVYSVCRYFTTPKWGVKYWTGSIMVRNWDIILWVSRSSLKFWMALSKWPSSKSILLSFAFWWLWYLSSSCAKALQSTVHRCWIYKSYMNNKHSKCHYLINWLFRPIWTLLVLIPEWCVYVDRTLPGTTTTAQASSSTLCMSLQLPTVLQRGIIMECTSTLELMSPIRGSLLNVSLHLSDSSPTTHVTLHLSQFLRVGWWFHILYPESLMTSCTSCLYAVGYFQNWPIIMHRLSCKPELISKCLFCACFNINK